MRFRNMINENMHIISAFIMCIILHYISAILYAKYCTPSTFIGFLLSPFMTLSPHCRALRWTISTFGDHICNSWIYVGIYAVGYINNIISKKE